MYNHESTTTPSSRDAAGSGALLSAVRPRQLVAQGQRVLPVPAGFLVAVRAFGRGRPEPRSRCELDADTGHSTLEGVRSRRGATRSFREALPDDP